MKIDTPATLERIAEELENRPQPPVKLLVSMGTCGIAAGTTPVLKAIYQEIAD